MRILVVDNYDSFVFNLVQYLGQLGVQAEVWRNDDARLSAEQEATTVTQFDGVLLSPGPGTPERAGASIGLVRACAATNTPLLGYAWATRPSASLSAPRWIAPRIAARQDQQRVPHECWCPARPSGPIHRDPLPLADDPAGVAARGPGGHREHPQRVIMAVQHTSLPIHGVQFHPESILTEGGHRMLANWLVYCGWARDETLVRRLENEVLAAVRPHLPESLPNPGATDRTSA